MMKQYNRKFVTGGVVVVKDEVEDGVSKTGKGWKKQVLVVDVGSERYPNPVKVTFWNDKVAKTASVGKGDEVEFSFYLRGSEYNDRYKVELNGDEIAVVVKSSVPEAESEESPSATSYDDVSDDMPF